MLVPFSSKQGRIFGLVRLRLIALVEYQDASSLESSVAMFRKYRDDQIYCNSVQMISVPKSIIHKVLLDYVYLAKYYGLPL